jgi:hypothetical protein
LFWPVHLGTCLRGEEAQRSAFGADWDAAMEPDRVLSAENEWPVFSVPLSSGHTVHVANVAYWYGGRWDIGERETRGVPVMRCPHASPSVPDWSRRW